MKILLISLFLPRKKASHAGGRYVFEMIKELSRRHELHLATRVEEQELPHLEELRPLCRKIHPYTYSTSAGRGLAGTIRLLFNYLGFSRYANKLIATGRYDIVQVEWVEAAILITKKPVPMVLDAHDVISKPAERRYLQAKGLRRIMASCVFKLMLKLESSISKRFDRIIVRSGVDERYLRALVPGAALSIVPHPAGLDITEKTYERSGNTILFLASYKYRQTNVDAARYFYRSVLPLVRKDIPDATFIIAGYGPPDELLAFQEKDSRVLVPGFVDDVDEYYKKAAVFVAPILVGGGIIVKILDAMAAGTPVVTTSFGNEGIGAEPGRDIIVADSPDVFAAKVVNVLSDRAYADRIAKNGQEYIRKRFGREAVFDKLESIYRRLKAR